MSCSGLKMFLVPRSSILADWAGASLRLSVCSTDFSIALELELEEEELILLAMSERKERDIMLRVQRETKVSSVSAIYLTSYACCTQISEYSLTPPHLIYSRLALNVESCGSISEL